MFDMGEPVRIMDVAKEIIRHLGYTPGPDVEILYTGIRRDERLYEEILTSEEIVIAIRQKKILVSREPQPYPEVFLVEIYGVENTYRTIYHQEIVVK